MEKQNQTLDALSVVELEARFETTVAAADADRCSGNTATVQVSAL